MRSLSTRSSSIPFLLVVALLWVGCGETRSNAHSQAQESRTTAGNTVDGIIPVAAAGGDYSALYPSTYSADAFDPQERMEKTEDEWHAELSESQFKVAREDGTERAFSGKYWDNKIVGTYECVGCGLDLFRHETKFKSGTGWPSFWAPIDLKRVDAETDIKYGMSRTEVSCRRCNTHLGHVFNDGPDPTGLRYCINSASLDFLSDEDSGH